MLQQYRQLIDDPVRLGAFQRAIGAAVKPGDVVADIGCGLGTYAIFAARAGARRVFAVDDSPIVEVAREVVRANRCEDVVEVVAGYSTALTPPEPCDVVIFEDYLTTLVSPHQARVVADLIGRWLKPGGQLLPPRARLWLAAVEDPEGYLAIDRFHWTQDRVFGVDFSPTRRRVFATPHPARLGPGALLTAPERAHDYDLRHLIPGLPLATGSREAPRLAPLASPSGVELSATRAPTATRDGVIHGIVVWWELELAGTWLGTGPLAPPSAWQQTLFPLATPIAVSAGQRIDVALQASPLHDTLIWRWGVGVGGKRVEASSLEGSPLPAGAVALTHPEHVPSAGAELEIDRAILDGVDGRRSLADVARQLRARFDGRFADDDAAVRRVAQVLARYA